MDEEVEVAEMDRCECRFCHNMVFLEDLDMHEQNCEVTAQKQAKASIFQTGSFPIVQMVPNRVNNSDQTFRNFMKTTHPSGVVP